MTDTQQAIVTVATICMYLAPVAAAIACVAGLMHIRQEKRRIAAENQGNDSE